MIEIQFLAPKKTGPKINFCTWSVSATSLWQIPHGYIGGADGFWGGFVMTNTMTIMKGTYTNTVTNTNTTMKST